MAATACRKEEGYWWWWWGGGGEFEKDEKSIFRENIKISEIFGLAL
jgi:hypothetical protein